MNTIRGLIYDDAVSLTIIDGTELIKEGRKIHRLNKSSTILFGKALLFTAFLSASLKGEKGSVSLLLKGDGSVQNLSLSGNYRLEIRGSIDEPTSPVDLEKEGVEDASLIFQKEGSITVVRDDGYARPFVGAVEPVLGDLDRQFEEYFRISEQLPTFLTSEIRFNEEGEVAFAGLVCLQPLPFASKEATKKSSDKSLQKKAIALMEKGVFLAGEKCYSASKEKMEEKEVRYRCNCSKNYISGVLVSVGEKALLDIVKEDGKVNVHCHYCNTDYNFYEEDIKELFKDGKDDEGEGCKN